MPNLACGNGGPSAEELGQAVAMSRREASLVVGVRGGHHWGKPRQGARLEGYEECVGRAQLAVAVGPPLGKQPPFTAPASGRRAWGDALNAPKHLDAAVPLSQLPVRPGEGGQDQEERPLLDRTTHPLFLPKFPVSREGQVDSKNGDHCPGWAQQRPQGQAPLGLGAP